MVLFHESIQVVDESVSSVLCILEMLAHMNRFNGAHFLTHAAKNTAELVDLVDDRVAVSLIVFTSNEADAVRWAFGVGRISSNCRNRSSGLSSNAVAEKKLAALRALTKIRGSGDIRMEQSFMGIGGAILAPWIGSRGWG